jgi:hypothetical protein
MKFRKKPIVIEATQWFKNGDHPKDDVTRGEATNGEEWEGLVVRYYRRPDDDGFRVCEKCHSLMHYHGWIDTLEGGHIVCPGDWIITGVAGEIYPCKPDIFEATYEPAWYEDLQTRQISGGDMSRDAFERWAKGKGLRMERMSTIDDSNPYYSAATQNAWIGWQAAESEIEIAIRQAVPIIREYARNNPKWIFKGQDQDPNGCHAWLEKYDQFEE